MTGNQEWHGDVLGRRSAADFLYQLTVDKHRAYHSEPGSGALCIALDGDWGSGKSFFINRWAADIRGKHHPVVHFDAWVNDLADDPLLGLMAQLQRELEPWLKKLPIKKKAKEAASAKFKEVMKQAPAALLPAAMVLLKGAGRKLIDVDTAEFSKLFESGDIGVDPNALRDVAKEGLDRFLHLALASHSNKQSSIKALKRSIDDLLTFLASQPDTPVSLPMFIFVDELDRCRPDFALRLLEGVKHLFDAQGVCFVFSTNLAQLQESAKAVYGAGFDGYRYFKRFFAFEYRLPDPDHYAFALVLARRSVMASKNIEVVSALPQVKDESKETILASNFAMVSESFQLNLRSQQQVFALADAASSGIPAGAPFYSLYMFVLAAAYHEGPKQFELAEKARFKELLGDRPPSVVHFKFTDRSNTTKAGFRSLVDLAGLYHSLAATNGEALRRQVGDLNTHDYPDHLSHTVAQEFRGAGQDRVRLRQFPSLGNYVSLMRRAGQVISLDPPTR